MTKLKHVLSIVGELRRYLRLESYAIAYDPKLGSPKAQHTIQPVFNLRVPNSSFVLSASASADLSAAMLATPAQERLAFEGYYDDATLRDYRTFMGLSEGVNAGVGRYILHLLCQRRTPEQVILFQKICNRPNFDPFEFVTRLYGQVPSLWITHLFEIPGDTDDARAFDLSPACRMYRSELQAGGGSEFDNVEDYRTFEECYKIISARDRVLWYRSVLSTSSLYNSEMQVGRFDMPFNPEDPSALARAAKEPDSLKMRKRLTDLCTEGTLESLPIIWTPQEADIKAKLEIALRVWYDLLMRRSWSEILAAEAEQLQQSRKSQTTYPNYLPPGLKGTT